jgi:hypothetical protein
MRVWCQVAHQTLSGAPGPGANEPATLGNSLGSLRYNSPDCPVCTRHVRWDSGATANWHQRSTAKVNSSEQCPAEVRAQKSEVTRHVRCGTGLSGIAKEQRVPTVNSSKLQRARWRGAYRTVNSGCPVRHRTVRCAHRQQSQLTARKWLEAINTPQPPPFKASKFSEILIQYKSNSIHSKTQFQRSNPLQVPKSTQPLRDLRERFFVFICALVAWIAFSPSHSYS